MINSRGMSISNFFLSQGKTMRFAIQASSRASPQWAMPWPMGAAIFGQSLGPLTKTPYDFCVTHLISTDIAPLVS